MTSKRQIPTSLFLSMASSAKSCSWGVKWLAKCTTSKSLKHEMVISEDWNRIDTWYVEKQLFDHSGSTCHRLGSTAALAFRSMAAKATWLSESKMALVVFFYHLATCYFTLRVNSELELDPSHNCHKQPHDYSGALLQHRLKRLHHFALLQAPPWQIVSATAPTFLHKGTGSCFGILSSNVTTIDYNSFSDCRRKANNRTNIRNLWKLQPASRSFRNCWGT